MAGHWKEACPSSLAPHTQFLSCKDVGYHPVRREVLYLDASPFYFVPYEMLLDCSMFGLSMLNWIFRQLDCGLLGHPQRPGKVLLVAKLSEERLYSFAFSQCFRQGSISCFTG